MICICLFIHQNSRWCESWFKFISDEINAMRIIRAEFQSFRVHKRTHLYLENADYGEKNYYSIDEIRLMLDHFNFLGVAW